MPIFNAYFVAYFPYIAKVKVGLRAHLAVWVYPPFQLLKDSTNFYQTWNVYHTTSGHLNNMFHKSLPPVIKTLQPLQLYCFMFLLHCTYIPNFFLLVVLDTQIVVKGKYAISYSENFWFFLKLCLQNYIHLRNRNADVISFIQLSQFIEFSTCIKRHWY
jgi:hypothetical protein